MWPDPVTPGMDCVLDMVGADVLIDLDLECAPDRGDAVRGRYGSEVGGSQDGELGEAGSVDRRVLVGFRGCSRSGAETLAGL